MQFDRAIELKKSDGNLDIILNDYITDPYSEIMVRYGNKNNNQIYGGGTTICPKFLTYHPFVVPIFTGGNINYLIGSFYMCLLSNYPANEQLTLRLYFDESTAKTNGTIKCFVFYR